MPFDERITQQSAPIVLAEHATRYRWVVPVAARCSCWIDLGCGNGTGIIASGPSHLEDIVLVDVDQDALDEATKAVGGFADTCTPITSDLATETGTAEVAAAVSQLRRGVVTCFEVFEHLDAFVHLVDLIVGLARNQEFTAFISIPNDAFWSTQNQYHRTTWSDGSFDELLQLLPSSRVVSHQYALSGSAITPVEVNRTSPDSSTLLPAAGISMRDDLPPSHFLVAFGPESAAVEPVSYVIQHDFERQRAWERQREADLEFYKAVAEGTRQ